MPPKRGGKAAPAPPPPPPLTGCTVAISGTFSTYTHSTIQAILVNLGASCMKSVGAATTHLVTTQSDYDGQTSKVKSAISKQIPIVSLQWVEDAENQNSKPDERDYVFDNPAPTNNGSHSRANGSRKRAASPAVDVNASKVPAQKKSKGASSQAVVKSEDKSEEKKVVAEGQHAKSKAVLIPLDETCPLINYVVHIDDDGLIWDAALNQTNASNNNNKFYRLQLLRDPRNGDFKTWTRWGRVGENGASAVLGSGSLADATNQFKKKFKDKSGLQWDDRTMPPKPGKYAFLERSYNPDSDEDDDEDGEAANVKAEDADEDWAPPQCTLEPEVQSLMQLIFNQQYFAANMSDLNYDANKLPLGKLSKGTITRGFQALKDLSALIDDPSQAANYDKDFVGATEDLSNLFYTLIPHSFGRNRPPVIRSQEQLKQEIVLLESLGDMKDAMALMKSERKDSAKVHALDLQFQGLGLDEMTVLDSKGTEYRELSKYLVESCGQTHYLKYDVQQIFRIERQGEKERFEKSMFAGPPKDRRLLWHGSRTTNYGGILSQGLRIAPPEAPVSGYMFGKGIYLADMSSKSANYCCHQVSNGQGLLLLCEAELGKPMQELTNASYEAGEDAKAKGQWSTWGKGVTGPSKWKDAHCLHPSLAGVMMPDVTIAPGDTNVLNAHLQYNEYICYDISQVRLRYLFRVKMN